VKASSRQGSTFTHQHSPQANFYQVENDAASLCDFQITKNVTTSLRATFRESIALVIKPRTCQPLAKQQQARLTQSVARETLNLRVVLTFCLLPLCSYGRSVSSDMVDAAWDGADLERIFLL
jgi:hypothetical protein